MKKESTQVTVQETGTEKSGLEAELKAEDFAAIEFVHLTPARFVEIGNALIKTLTPAIFLRSKFIELAVQPFDYIRITFITVSEYDVRTYMKVVDEPDNRKYIAALYDIALGKVEIRDKQENDMDWEVVYESPMCKGEELTETLAKAMYIKMQKTMNLFLKELIGECYILFNTVIRRVTAMDHLKK